MIFSDFCRINTKLLNFSLLSKQRRPRPSLDAFPKHRPLKEEVSHKEIRVLYFLTRIFAKDRETREENTHVNMECLRFSLVFFLVLALMSYTDWRWDSRNICSLIKATNPQSSQRKLSHLENRSFLTWQPSPAEWSCL